MKKPLVVKRSRRLPAELQEQKQKLEQRTTSTYSPVKAKPKRSRKKKNQLETQRTAERTKVLIELENWSAKPSAPAVLGSRAKIDLASQSDTINWNDTSEDGSMWRR